MTQVAENKSLFGKDLVQKYVDTIEDDLKFLNEELQKATYLVGERVSVADLYMVLALQSVVKLLYTQQQFEQKFNDVNRYIKTVRASLPPLAQVYGEVEFAKAAFINRPFIGK